jgi:hypothetical protein
MQRDSELDYAQSGAEVTSGNSDSVNRFATQFVGDLSQLTGFQAPEVLRGFDLVEQWGL